jgi:hypothetical protein
MSLRYFFFSARRAAPVFSGEDHRFVADPGFNPAVPVDDGGNAFSALVETGLAVAKRAVGGWWCFRGAGSRGTHGSGQFAAVVRVEEDERVVTHALVLQGYDNAA